MVRGESVYNHKGRQNEKNGNNEEGKKYEFFLYDYINCTKPMQLLMDPTESIMRTRENHKG